MVLVLTLVGLLAAQAERVQQAEDWLAESEFELAAGEAETVLGLRNADPTQQVRLHRVAFLARYYLGQKDLAAAQAQAWVRLDANAALDAKRFPPDVVAFFNDNKEKVKPRVEVVRAAPTASTFQPLSLIPLGIGHFLVGDPVGGAIFLASEVGFLAANLTLYGVRVKDRRPLDQYANPGLASGLQVGQNIAAGLACAAVVIELIDALVFLPGRVAARPVKAALTAGGIVVAGEF